VKYALFVLVQRHVLPSVSDIFAPVGNLQQRTPLF